MKKTRNQLNEQSTVIRNEAQQKANTKTRVADMVDAVAESCLNATDDKASSAEVIAGTDTIKYIVPSALVPLIGSLISQFNSGDASLEGRIQLLEVKNDTVTYGILDTNPYKGKGFKLFADSIGYGQGAPTTEMGYGYRIAAYIGGPFTNYSMPGDRYYNQLPHLMRDLPLPNRDHFAMCGLGANDIRGANWNLFPVFTEMFLVQHFSTARVKSTETAVRKSGNWQVFSDIADSAATLARMANPDALVSTDIGSYQEWDFTGTSVYVNLFASTQGSTLTQASYIIAIDGVVKLTQNNYNTAGGGNDWAGYSYTQLFNGLEPGNHTIRVTHNGDYGSSSYRFLSVDFYGQLMAPQDTKDVAFMEVPQIDTFLNGNLDIHLRTKIVNAQLEALETKWQNMGYKAWLIKHFIYVAANSVDGLHPDRLGHLQWFLESISLPCMA